MVSQTVPYGEAGLESGLRDLKVPAFDLQAVLLLVLPELEAFQREYAKGMETAQGCHRVGDSTRWLLMTPSVNGTVSKILPERQPKLDRTFMQHHEGRWGQRMWGRETGS